MTPANEIMRNYIYKNSNIPAYYLNNNINLSPETEDIEAFYRLKNIENQCVRFFREHWNLNLYSNTVGNGKTSWAIKIVRAYIDTYACNYGNVDCLYINVPDFMALRKRGFVESTVKQEKSKHIGLFAIAVLIIVTCVLFILSMRGII